LQWEGDCLFSFLITYILEAGATVKEAQVLARHSTPLLTMNTYARTRDSRLTDLTEKVAERLFFQAIPDAHLTEKQAGTDADSYTLANGQDQTLTDKKQKKCAKCVQKVELLPFPKNRKLLINSNLHQFKGNGGGGIRTPVP
jgi:hypothetical protein